MRKGTKCLGAGGGLQVEGERGGEPRLILIEEGLPGQGTVSELETVEF